MRPETRSQRPWAEGKRLKEEAGKKYHKGSPKDSLELSETFDAQKILAKDAKVSTVGASNQGIDLEPGENRGETKW